MSKPNPIAFSTLACPDWNLTQILEAAVRYGYDAVELRGYQSEMDLPRAAPFTPANRLETHQRFNDAGIAVSCVSSSGVIAQGNVDHVRAHAALARELNCPYVRVFGGKLPNDISRSDALDTFAETLRAFGNAAQAEGVSVVLETHDAFSTGKSVGELLSLADHPAVFVLWDLHHPHRQGETWQETLGYVLPFLSYVHVKDGTPGGYTFPGDGDVPLAEILDALAYKNYTGPLSVEWEKRWHPELPDPEMVLPAYANYLRNWLK